MAIFPFSRGKHRISQGVENRGSLISAPLALREGFCAVSKQALDLEEVDLQLSIRLTPAPIVDDGKDQGRSCQGKPIWKEQQHRDHIDEQHLHKQEEEVVSWHVQS